MNKYLIDLLKENNTIIIPGLGALTVTNTDTGEMMFMPYLQHDDGKLSGFIAQQDGVDEQDAKNTIAKYVREINSALDKGETVDLYSLGSFVKENGEIEFTNWTGSTSSAASEALETVQVAQEIVEEATTETQENSEEIIEIAPETVAETIDQGDEGSPEIVEEPAAETTKISEEIIEIVPETVAETIDEADQGSTEIVEESGLETTQISEEIVETPQEDSNPTEDALEEIAPIIAAEVVHQTLETNIEEPNIEAPKAEIPVAPEVTASEPVVEEETRVQPEPKKSTATAPVLEKTVAPNAKTTKEKTPKTANSGSAAKKRGAGFWMLMTLLVLIVAGGTYFAINYNELKQHIPFLADEKETVKPPEAKPEMEEIDNGDSEEMMEEETIADPEEMMEEEPVEKPKPVEKPAPSASTDGAYHIVSGAFSSIANANRLMESFKAQGLPARVIENNGLNVVCMQSFATSAEAKANLAAMKEKAPSAWILHKP